MTHTNNLQIDDNLIAAYLDGKLDDQQSEIVENAIEKSPELQWIVDRWLEEQTAKPSFTNSEIKLKEAISIKPNLRQALSIAASLLVLIALTIPILYKIGSINKDSGMSESFPASNTRVPSEHSNMGNLQPINTDTNNIEEETFTWTYEIYKSSLIIMWGQRMDTVNGILYSSDGRELAFCDTWNSHAMVLPVAHIKEEDKPLWLSIRFSRLIAPPYIIENDSVIIDY